jgi:N6-L-threonylcarbamoyladenine synthase
LYFLRDNLAENENFIKENINDICASFQRTLIDVLMNKLVKAAKATGIKDIVIGGGVSANSELRQRIVAEGEKRGWRTFVPEFKFTTDNAAMIAIAGLYKFRAGLTCDLDAAPVSRALDFNK